MVEQISQDNTSKLLLEGNGVKAPQPRPVRRPKASGDVVVENATEKRYLWTARAFAVIFAISMCCNFISGSPFYRYGTYKKSKCFN